MRKLLKVLMFTLMITFLFAFSFTSTANADTTNAVFTKISYDVTRGVKLTTTLYVKVEDKNNIDYYSITKVTGKITILDGRTVIKGVTVKMGQNGSYMGKPIAQQTLTTKPKNVFSYTVYPDSKWKPVAKTWSWSVVGTSAVVDIQRGNSKWTLPQSNNVPF